jgi:predicted regulator of Ras-like GTPase activity (Roadblock/LC7/MglB family)
VPGLKDELQSALVRLNQSAPEIKASAFVSLDGLMLASALPSGTNEDAIAAMSATVLGLGERTTKEFTAGELEQVYFKGKEGYIILQAAEEDGVLVVVTDETAKLGILFLLLKRTSDEIRFTVSRAITPKVSESGHEAKPAGPSIGKPRSPWSS